MKIVLNELIKTEQYSFLQENEHLKDRLIFLALGGSHAYGTSTPDSDTDLRGCAFNSKSDLIGLTNFEQVVRNEPDTTIYSFNKLIGLVSNCNPNVIEMLGCNPEHHLICHPVGQELIDNKKMFLSQRARKSFAGYSYQQLNRIRNAIARDALGQTEKENHMLRSVKSQMASFNDRYREFDEGAIRIYIDESDREDLETEIFMDVTLKHYPLRDYKNMCSEMNEVVKVYGKLNHRNKKKEKDGLAKHACHLVRLFLMAIDIFEKEEINTYRADDLELLCSIRNGKYQNEDGTYQNEFFELVDEYDKQMEYAFKNTGLPVQPDYNRIQDFVMSVNERVVRGEV